MPNQPAPLDVNDVIDAYRAGESVARIARRVHTDNDRIAGILHDHGIATARRMALDDADIARRYGDGESENTLAKAHGVSRGAIRRRLREQGVPIRGILEANRLMMAARSPEENRRNAEAAHAAVRGVPQPTQARINRALAAEGKGPQTAAEAAVLAELEARGYTCVTQKAVGRYNIDIAVDPVAVEIFGGNWHASGYHFARWPERRQRLFDEGWNLVAIWVNTRKPFLPAVCADHVVAYVEASRSDPSLRGQEWMIRGDGQPATAMKRKFDDVA